MIRQKRELNTQLAVIGAGMAGCAATMFALNRGIATLQIGNTGALAYTTGFLDLLGALQGQSCQSPWQALTQLRRLEPEHPYSKIEDTCIRDAFEEFVAAINEMGMHYTRPGKDNLTAVLPAGVCKPTYCMPISMRKFDEARRKKARVLILDFAGLSGFSAREIIANLGQAWPGLRASLIDFPEIDSNIQIYPEVMARALEVAQTRQAFAGRIKQLKQDAEYIAMPAILGIHGVDSIHSEMEALIGLPVFEIPTIPPAVPGIRLRELFEQKLAERGAVTVNQKRVENVTLTDKSIDLHFQDNFGEVVVKTQYLLLASGRFLSGGLVADQHQVRETLLDLPVRQPVGRENWFSKSCFDATGHALNRAGVDINACFQPLDERGCVVDERLYAAGILLAGQDWIRQRCGAGVAIASAFKAVTAIQASITSA